MARLLLVAGAHLLHPVQPGSYEEPLAALCGADLGQRFNVKLYVDPRQVVCPTCYAKAPYVAPVATITKPIPKPLPPDPGRQTSLF